MSWDNLKAAWDNDAEFAVDTGKVAEDDEPVRAPAVAGQTFLGFVAKDATALVGEPKPCGIAFVIEVGGRSGGVQKIASVGRLLLESALCVRRSSSMSSRLRSVGSVASAKSKREGALPCLELIFGLVCMIPRLLYHQPACMGDGRFHAVRETPYSYLVREIKSQRKSPLRHVSDQATGRLQSRMSFGKLDALVAHFKRSGTMGYRDNGLVRQSAQVLQNAPFRIGI